MGNELAISNLLALSKESIEEVEDRLLQHPQVECPVIHRFSPGLYIRELFMPAGTFAIGHHQNFEHFNVMLKGKVLMLNDDGTTSEVVAPVTFTGKQGRKIGVILEDMVWQNIYPNHENETDVNKLEEKFLTKSDAWKYNEKLRQDMLFLQSEADRNDYQKMLHDLNVTHEQVITESENELDQIQLKMDELKIKLDDSPIQGNGIFATSFINAGEIISLASYEGMRTQAGRYTNHSVIPNAFMKKIDNNIFLIAARNIEGCKGGENGEEITIDYRQAYLEASKLELHD